MNDSYFSENVRVETKPKKQKKSVSVSTLIISIVATIVFVFIIANKRWKIVSIFWFDSQEKEQNVSSQLNVWDEVSLSWIIDNNWDIINYTHTIESLEFWELALKSSKINLNNYKNEVYIEGIVEKVYQGIPIVWVSIIYSLDLNEDEEQDDILELNYESKFLANIGIYLDSEFFQKYSLLNEWEWWILKIKNSETNEIINLSYFLCSSSDNNKNCERFNQIFVQSNAEKFIDTYGISYYKQTETQSRFFSNDSLFWYFINDVNDSLTKDLIKYIQIINKSFIEKNILNKIDILCRESGNWIKKIDETSISLKNQELFVDIKWNNESESFECKLKINPNLKNMATLVELKSLWEIEKQDTNDNSENKDKIEVNYDRDSDVPQFPINLEKALTFTSRKWFSYVFPSSNIAYAAQNTQKDFEQLWVNCYSVMNVVQYSEKELVNQKWEVKVYECSIKEHFKESKNLIHKKIWEKEFVIEIINPAWVAFANNIWISVEW